MLFPECTVRSRSSWEVSWEHHFVKREPLTSSSPDTRWPGLGVCTSQEDRQLAHPHPLHRMWASYHLIRETPSCCSQRHPEIGSCSLVPYHISFPRSLGVAQCYLPLRNENRSPSFCLTSYSNGQKVYLSFCLTSHSNGQKVYLLWLTLGPRLSPCLSSLGNSTSQWHLQFSLGYSLHLSSEETHKNNIIWYNI